MARRTLTPGIGLRSAQNACMRSALVRATTDGRGRTRRGARPTQDRRSPPTSTTRARPGPRCRRARFGGSNRRRRCTRRELEHPRAGSLELVDAEERAQPTHRSHVDAEHAQLDETGLLVAGDHRELCPQRHVLGNHRRGRFLCRADRVLPTLAGRNTCARIGDLPQPRRPPAPSAAASIPVRVGVASEPKVLHLPQVWASSTLPGNASSTSSTVIIGATFTDAHPALMADHLVLEYVPGATLHAAVSRVTVRPWARRLRTGCRHPRHPSAALRWSSLLVGPRAPSLRTCPS